MSSECCSGPSWSASALTGMSSGEMAVSTTSARTALASVGELAGVDRPADEEADERLGHRGVDVVVRHLVADAVRRPAQRELGEVAGAQHERAVVVGQAEQVRGALAGLDVLVGDVVLGLAPSAAGWPMSRSIWVADGLMSISAALTPSALHQRVGVAQRARAGGKARQRVAQHVGARQPQPVHRPRRHDQRVGAVQAARHADHELLDARWPAAASAGRGPGCCRPPRSARCG